MQRIGVFICWCGSNIAATVDVKALREALAAEPGVVLAQDYQYMCSEAGQKLIQTALAEQRLDGVVVASCSPRMHEGTFRKAATAAGLNPYLLEIANIREHCSWIHKDQEAATAKALTLIRAAIAKVRLNQPLRPGTSGVVKRALVIGGGIAGLQAALDIAEAGFPVDIVEQAPTIGGKMAQLDKTFPTLDCSACILTPKMVEAATHPQITLHTYSEVAAVAGFVGNFTVQIRHQPRSVDAAKCTGCGVCSAKCPSKANANEFNCGLDRRAAIYIPFAQAVPNLALIDRAACRYFQTGKCGVCAKVCPAGAVDYAQQAEITERQYGAIVLATGYEPLDTTRFGEYAYGWQADVLTSLELERLTNAAGPSGGQLLRPSNA